MIALPSAIRLSHSDLVRLTHVHKYGIMLIRGVYMTDYSTLLKVRQSLLFGVSHLCHLSNFNNAIFLFNFNYGHYMVCRPRFMHMKPHRSEKRGQVEGLETQGVCGALVLI